MPDRVALVTGASSGIGRATAIALNAAGWVVVLTARRKAELEETVQLMGDVKHAKTRCVVGDLVKKDDVRSLFEVIKDELGRLDLLFNNAGRSSPTGPVDEISIDQFEELMAVNVTAPVMCAQEAIKIMKAQTPQGGRIINNGSLSAYVPRPQSAPYSMSKHAILALTKSIALDYRQYNIACSQVDIGNAQTPLTLHHGGGHLQPDGSRRVEPFCDVKHVADAVVFMANLPLEVNILNQTIMATNMPFVGRG